ncbi:kynureninase [Acinetobacter geminorum]|uniref:kynureninase n=1 Tax=Acinetobacter geminorum TaxID=2730922 RepID=UPI003AF76693
MEKLIIIFIPLFFLGACTNEDSNSKPIYGNESGLPANCRAYIQVAVNEWRKGTYDTDTTMDAIERNCGENGNLWDYKPN